MCGWVPNDHRRDKSPSKLRTPSTCQTLGGFLEGEMRKDDEEEEPSKPLRKNPCLPSGSPSDYNIQSLPLSVHTYESTDFCKPKEKHVQIPYNEDRRAD
ncbi:unnamed protein product [Allacma fusca]|uniref:Uncharacterized protein n=1 Tax=Allacma fusca TaxID=39272 RepID=A0A8J2M750_9HEXA|nr:unnamed protein product [Allacma fusca]